jgi:serine/threonine protein kinase
MARVLIIEDDVALSDIICDQLTADGYEVDRAHTGRQAQKYLGQTAYDLLVMDWDLPDASGVEICRTLRTGGSVIPVLMLTGHRDVEDKEFSFEAGADDYITKPFSIKELRIRIKALLRRAAQPSPTQVAEAAPAQQVGQLLAEKYRLDEFIGQGGTSVIFKATHIGMLKTVAVKLMHPHLLDNDSMRARFEQECMLMARINHINVGSIYDAGNLPGDQPYMVMEYVQGHPLSAVLEHYGALTVADALQIMIQCCSGLGAVHAAGIVHRDLKPDNILLQKHRDRADWVKIVDFGISHLVNAKRRLTTEGKIIGTFGFMAPEQLRQRPVDFRADIYSLGVILYAALTNELPYKADTTEAFFIKQLIEPPDPLTNYRPDIPPGSAVDLLWQKAMAKEPEQRFQSAGEMLSELQQALSSCPA